MNFPFSIIKVMGFPGRFHKKGFGSNQIRFLILETKYTNIVSIFYETRTTN